MKKKREDGELTFSREKRWWNPMSGQVKKQRMEGNKERSRTKQLCERRAKEAYLLV